MKVRVEATTLAGLLADVVRVVPARPFNPVLAGVRLTAADDNLTAHATDLDVTVDASTSSVDVLDAGSALLPGRMLRDVAASLRGQVTVTVDDQTGVLTAGRTRVALPVIAHAEDYPSPAPAPAVTGATGADALRSALARLSPCARGSAQGMWTTCVHLRAEGDHLVLHASDSYRAGRATVPWAGVGGMGVAPLRSVADALRGAAGDEVALGFGPDLLSVACEDRTTLLRAVDSGRLGQVAAIFDGMPEPQATAVVDGAALLDVCDATLAMATDREAATIHLVPERDGLAHDGSGVSGVLDAETTGDVGVHLAAHWLREMVRALGADRLRIAAVDTNKPVTLSDANRDDVRLVLMTRRV